jgi:hypothetical protein
MNFYYYQLFEKSPCEASLGGVDEDEQLIFDDSLIF